MNTAPLRVRSFLASISVFLVCAAVFPERAAAQPGLSSGNTLYVPIYSNVYSGPRKAKYQLAAMLSIRNTDPAYPIRIVHADYYDNDGKLVDSYVEETLELAPLASHNFYIREYDERGGTGANFIVQWASPQKVNQPIIQGVMLGMKSGQGISFICPGQVIVEHGE